MKQSQLILIAVCLILFSYCTNKPIVKENQDLDINNPKTEVTSNSEELTKIENEILEGDLEKSLLRGSKNIELIRTLAGVKSNLNKHQEAIKLFSTIIDDKTTDCTLFRDRAYAYLKVDSFLQSIDDLNNAIILCSETPELYKWRGYSYLHNQQFRESIIDLTQYLAANKMDKDAFYMRAHAYYSLQNLNAACADIRQSGYTSEQMGDYPELKKCLD